jgi:hypothetical protein
LHPRLEAQGWANYCFWISFRVVVIIRCLVSVYFRWSFYPVTTNCFGYTTTKCVQHRPSGGRYGHAAVQQIFRPLRSSIVTILPLDYTPGLTNQITRSRHTYLTFILSIFSSLVWDRDTYSDGVILVCEGTGAAVTNLRYAQQDVNAGLHTFLRLKFFSLYTKAIQ